VVVAIGVVDHLSRSPMSSPAAAFAYQLADGIDDAVDVLPDLVEQVDEAWRGGVYAFQELRGAVKHLDGPIELIEVNAGHGCSAHRRTLALASRSILKIGKQIVALTS
jgi:hypothetical protein